jgi:putative membrane protein
MKNDFSHPQRQSLVGVVVMFTDTFQQYARALWPLLIIVALRLDEFNKLYLGLGIAAIVLLGGGIAYLQYLNFTFHLDEDNEEFVIKKGVLNKSRLAIPLDKIQQVNINQSIIQRIIGVHALEVDTAGSGKKEVSIRAITHDIALSLKARLLEGSAPKPAENEDDTREAVPVGEHPFIQISFLSLLKTGITSNYVRSFALLIAFFITAFQYIEDFITYADIEDDPLDQYINAEVVLKFVVFIIVAILMLTLVVNLSRTIIKYFDFKITRQQNSLLLSYGLLNTKSTIIRPEKVQILTIGRNYFQKKLNILDLKIRQALGDEFEPDSRKLIIEIPGCKEQEKDVLLQFLLGKIPQRGTMLKPNYRKFVFNLFKTVLLPVGIFLLIGRYIFPYLFEYLMFVPVYVIFVTLLVFFGYRNNRLFVDSEFIICQHGAWDVDNDFLAPHKIQSIVTHQYFWQKHADVGSLILCTAGGDVNFGVADYTKIKQLVNQWLFQVETSKKHWMY